MNMWRAVLIFNALILLLFWLAAQVAIAPAYTNLVRYADMRVALPLLTDFAIRIRLTSVVVPISWGILTFFWGRRLTSAAESARGASVNAHTSLTLCIGLAILLFFSLAGILPILKFSAIIE